MLSSLIAISAVVLGHVVRDNLQQIAIQDAVPQIPLIQQTPQDQPPNHSFSLPNILDIAIP
jgi:hypothetical protein